MEKILRVLGYICCVLAFALWLAGMIGIWLTDGFTGVQEVLSPFNVINWLVTVLTFAPGIVLI